jgi:hypothetical protein
LLDSLAAAAMICRVWAAERMCRAGGWVPMLFIVGVGAGVSEEDMVVGGNGIVGVIAEEGVVK